MGSMIWTCFASKNTESCWQSIVKTCSGSCVPLLSTPEERGQYFQRLASLLMKEIDLNTLRTASILYTLAEAIQTNQLEELARVVSGFTKQQLMREKEQRE